MTVELDTGQLTISAAARITGVDRRLIRRHLEAGRFPGAVRTPGASGGATGPWRIPVADLRAAGLLGDEPPVAAGVPPSAGSPPSPNVGLELIRLRAELEVAVRRAELAEATVLECERLIEAQRLALADRDAASRQRSRLAPPTGRAPSNAHAPTRRSTPPPTGPIGPTGPTDDSPSPLLEEVDAAAHGPVPVPCPGPRHDPAPPAPSVVDQSPPTPRFATSWASVPPWEHNPAATPPPRRRWWQRGH